MDKDTKHVLTVLGLFVCFGAGYFTCKLENRTQLRIGNKFIDFQTVEDNTAGKAKFEIKDDEIAVQNAINGYYRTGDKYFTYVDNIYKPVDEEEEEEETPEDSYKMIGDVLYIDYNFFSTFEMMTFEEAFKEFPDADKYIIDLRDNLGGSTETCQSILGAFIGKKTVGKEIYYDGKVEDITAPESKYSIKGKVVILTNGKTASSSELFCAAMKQFYPDTTLVGEKTFGKGIFQYDEVFGEDHEIRYTAGYYTVGSWDCYQDIGIEPDIEVKMNYSEDIAGTEDDVQLQAALDLFD